MINHGSLIALVISLSSFPVLHGEFLYTADFQPGAMAGYSINSATGALTPVPGSPYTLGGLVSSVATDPTGSFLYVTRAKYLNPSYSNNIAVFRIDPTTGALTEISGSPFAVASCPLSIAIHSSGKFAYIGSGDPPGITVYNINSTTGALTTQQQLGNSQYQVGLATDPTGKFLYSANGPEGLWQPPVVFGYSIDLNSGILTSLPGSPFSADGNTPSWITIHPSGRFAYAADSSSGLASGDLSGYALDSSGALTTVPGSPFPVGQYPVSAAIDASGTFAYVANQQSSSISSFRINASTGSLTPLPAITVAGAGFTYLAVDCTGKFLYSAGWAGRDVVYGYSINAQTGGL